MTNQDTSDFRRHYQLSAPTLAGLLRDPVTRKQVSARTIYRWEHSLPEVIIMPDWVASAFAALQAKFTKAGRAKFVARGAKRSFLDEHTSQISSKTWNGTSWE